MSRPGCLHAVRVIGRVVDGEGKPITGAKFDLVYDDAQGIPHIEFPTGWWVPTDDETKREKRTNAYFEQRGPVTINETSGEDGRFRIREVVPGAKFHLHIIIDQAGRRLGPKAPANRGEKRLRETALAAGQSLDLGDVRILPEDLRGDPAPTLNPPLIR